MKSPTSSILHSIQILKNRLRNDHQQLQGIRRDFAMGPIQSIKEQDRAESPVSLPKRSLDKKIRQKIAEVRKNHQQELKQMLEEQQKINKELSEKYEKRISQIIGLCEHKINEQDTYVKMLEEQLQYSARDAECSPKIHNSSLWSQIYNISITQTFNKQSDQVNQKEEQILVKQMHDGKYEQIVNNLLKENTLLLEHVERLKMENRKLILNKGSTKPQQQINTRKQYVPFKHDKTKRSNYQIAPFEVEQTQGNTQRNYFSVSSRQEEVTMRNSIKSKNRLKFSKAAEDRAKGITEGSFMNISNQNMDTSNMVFQNASSVCQKENCDDVQSICLVDDDLIEQQDVKLKTIRHFMKVASDRSTEDVLIEKVKRTRGIKNIFRIV